MVKMVEVVIKIPEDARARLAFGVTYTQDMQAVCDALSEGVVLPKEHGRLIDADAFIKFMQTVSKTRKYDELWIDNFLTVDDVFNAVIESLKNEGTANGNAPTIIEADKEKQ